MAIAYSVIPRPFRISIWAVALSLAFAAAGSGQAWAQAPATARVFTINELLAKHDTGRPNAAGRTAAVERPDTASDASRAASRGQGPEPFGLFAVRAPEGQLWTKWRGLEAELKRETAEIDACRTDPKQCPAAAKRFVAIVGEIQSRTGRPRLEVANRLMNGAVRYVSDQQQHGVADRWTAPLATIAAEAGDCEDYAVAKYAALRDAGVPESDMRLVLVRDTTARLDHAVLAVRHDGGWLMLDNRRTFVAEPHELKHYMPLFALDREGVKLFAAQLASWGDGGVDFAAWNLRGSDGAEFAAVGAEAALDTSNWTLRGSNAEPAAAN